MIEFVEVWRVVQLHETKQQGYKEYASEKNPGEVSLASHWLSIIPDFL